MRVPAWLQVDLLHVEAPLSFLGERECLGAGFHKLLQEGMWQFARGAQGTRRALRKVWPLTFQP